MPAKIKFYTDEHVSRAVIAGLRRRGIDVLSTREASKLGAPDIEHLTFARKEGRVIVTQDDDFLRLHAGGEEHTGIAYAQQQISIGEIIRGLILIYQVLDAEEMINHIEFIRVKLRWYHQKKSVSPFNASS